MHQSVVYALNDPITGWIRYIGKTSVGPTKRMREHLCDARNGKKLRVYNWIRSLLAINRLPIMSILNTCQSDEEAQERERYWISRYKVLCNLTNLTEGGEGIVGLIRTSEHKRKISLAQKGRKFTPEHCLAMSLSRKGKKYSLERRNSINRHRLGVSLPQSVRDAIGAGNLGKRRSAEVKAAMSLARKGRKHTAETKAKMSATRKGMVKSKEHRAALSIAKLALNLKGRPWPVKRRQAEMNRKKNET